MKRAKPPLGFPGMANIFFNSLQFFKYHSNFLNRYLHLSVFLETA